MKSKFFSLSCFLTILSLTSLSQNSQLKTFVVGGTSILIPKPASNSEEANDELKSEASLYIVPNSNRLLELYIFKDSDLRKKMCVQVSKSLEPYDIDEKRFYEFKDGVKPLLSKNINEVLSELNNHLLTVEDIIGQIDIGETKMIATLFEDKLSVAFLLVTKINTLNGSINLLSGMSSIKVKNKIIFVYVFDFYDNTESINWVSSMTNSWTKSILSANK